MASPSAPGQLILQWPALVVREETVTTLAFSPALAQIVHPQWAAFQRVNAADNQKLFVFSISPNEQLDWALEFIDLPWDDDALRQTQGYQALRNFVRTTLNYSEQLFVVQSPDGDVEVVRYLRGLETFVEAGGQSKRHLRWQGTLIVRRYL